MAKKKTLKKGRLISLYLEESHIKHIQKIAHKMSIQENETISLSKAIRLALDEVYPNPEPKQIDLFEEKKRRRIMPLKKKASYASDGEQAQFAF